MLIVVIRFSNFHIIKIEGKYLKYTKPSKIVMIEEKKVEMKPLDET